MDDNNYEVIERENGWRVIRTSCGCKLKEHVMDVEVEKDRDFGVTLLFNYKLSLKEYIYMTEGRPNDNAFLRFFQIWWGKIKLIVAILLRNEISFEEGFLFRGGEHAEDVADWIKKTAKEVKNDEL